MSKDNVVNFPPQLDPALRELERRLVKQATGRNISDSHIKLIIERVQPLRTALTAPLALEIPDTTEAMAAFKLIEEPLKVALVKRVEEAVWAQLKEEAKRLI